MLFLLPLEYFGKLFFGGRFVLYEISLRLKSGEHFVLRIIMLSVTGLNHFYYVRDFTDMRCKHSRVLSVIRERFHRELNDGDVFIVMSRNRRIVRMFSFDNRSYSLFEKKFVAGYQFMKVERNGADTVYRIDWKDVALILESSITKMLKIR